MTIPIPSATPVKRIPSPRIRRSWLRGISEMTNPPKVGTNTARLTADFSQPLIAPLSALSSMDQCEHDGHDAHPEEQECRVPLDAARLDQSELSPTPSRGLARGVDCSIDHALAGHLHGVSHPSGQPGRDARRAS